MDKKEYNKIAEEVVKRYRENILPRIRKLEAERITSRKTANKITILTILITLVFIVINVHLSVFALLIGLSIKYAVCKKFELKVKEKIMPYLCQCFGNLKWSQGVYYSMTSDGIEGEKLLKNSCLFDTNASSKFRYDDIFVGEFRDLNFKIIELSSTIGAGKNRRVAFSGVVVIIETNKTIKGNTVIRPDSFLHLGLNCNLKHTVLEDVEFEKKYDVYTDDEVEARYVITTAFMERLNNIQMSFSVDKISCAFFEKYLLIGLYTKKDTFKFAKLNKSLTDYTEFSRLFKEIMSIYEMIDYFKLAEKTKL